MELNNTIATPLYKQLEEKLQHEIETGDALPEAASPQKTN